MQTTTTFKLRDHFQCLALLGVLVLALSALLACNDEDIHAYRVPKDGQSSSPIPAPSAPSEAAQQGVTWTLPADWSQIPGERPMRIATFRAGAGETAPEVSVSAFPGDAGGLLANINRWRGQIGLDPLDAASLSTAVRTTTTNDHSVSIVDMMGADGKRMLGAVIVPGDGQTWFVKATDAPKQIELITSSFDQFAHSFRISKSTLPPSHPPITASANAGIPGRLKNWSPPASWSPDPNASPILTAAYLAENDSSGARITVTSLRGAGGGTLANINRWRGQIGLDPVGSLTVQPATDLGNGNLIVDLISPDRSSRIVAAIFPAGQSTWFFKMTGNADGIEPELSSFNRFVHDVGLGSPASADTNAQSEQAVGGQKGAMP